jgi:hypothetical protein
MTDDKQLRETARIIQEILQTQQLGGIIFVASKTEAVPVLELSPPWSCMKFNDQTGECTIQAHINDFPSEEARLEAIRDSREFVHRLLDAAKYVVSNLEKVATVFPDGDE